jgi:predicted nucleic acid-binding protein
MIPPLLDTNVLSETAKPRPNPRVLAFLSQSPTAFISVITIHELRRGAELVKAESKRQKLLDWLTSFIANYENRILPITLTIAESAAQLRADATHRGRVLHIEDALIAATAHGHHLAVATRNTKDFAVTGIETINPWDHGGA